MIEPDGAGTRITCTRHREFFGARGRLAGTVMRLIGPAVLKRQLRAGTSGDSGETGNSVDGRALRISELDREDHVDDLEQHLLEAPSA